MFVQQNSDSSDDDICFGKYTIKEAKKDLQKYVPKKINRRHSHTLICELNESQAKTREENSDLTNKFKEEDNTSLNSNAKSKYSTASENMSNDRLSQNSEFLEKLNKVINEPVSEASSYNTALNETNFQEKANNYCDDTFLERFKHSTSIALDNIQATLLGNTVLSTEDSLSKVGNNDSRRDESCSSDEDIISISDVSSSQLYSADEPITDKDTDVSDNPNLFSGNDGIECKQLISEVTHNEEVGGDSKITIKSPVVYRKRFVFGSNHYSDSQNCNYSLQDESEITQSSFGFESLNLTEPYAEPIDYSCNLQGSSEYLSVEQYSYENTSPDLNVSEPKPLQKFERIIADCYQLSKISEKTEFTTCSEDTSKMQQHEKTALNSFSGIAKYENSARLGDCIQENKSSILEIQDLLHYNSSLELSKKSSISVVSELSKNFGENKLLQIGSDTLPVSSVETPEILKQLDDYSQFDDSLEDMNRFLEQGPDYEMPATQFRVTPVKEPLLSNDIISGSFMNMSSNTAGLEHRTSKTKTVSSRSVEKCKNFYSSTIITKPLMEGQRSTTVVKSRYQQDPTSLSPAARNLFVKHTDKLGDNAFKVPTKPVKKLLTPSKLPKPISKSVASPVGLYIKHSPKYCPMIKVPQNSGNSRIRMSNFVKPDSTSIKENIFCASPEEIPKVIYKPAKHKQIKEEKEIILPGSIKKLITEQVVTKHERRIQDDECNQSIERRLMESDLSIDLSQNSHDISILTNKQPFNIRKF